MYIDTLQVSGFGYLLDNDGNGIYDALRSVGTNQTTTVQKKDGSYLFDIDGDGRWDYIYNITSGLTSSYKEQEKTPGFEIIFVLCSIAVAILLWKKKQSV